MRVTESGDGDGGGEEDVGGGIVVYKLFCV